MHTDRPKQERFDEFVLRLKAALSSNTLEEAYDQLCKVLNAVEDELTSIPYNPDAWETDGRMYPPQADSTRNVDGHPRVTPFRSRNHNTFLGENGAIEIQTTPDAKVLFTKVGGDQRGIWGL